MSDLRLSDRLLAVFRAGRVRRWHANPDLAWTVDCIDGHAGRVARIILALHPSPSLRLVRAALLHDDGEHAVGDIKAPAKDAHPGLADWLDGVERAAREGLWGADPALTPDERDWLVFADRLDALIWVSHHAPHALTGDGWPEAQARLRQMADRLGAVAFQRPRAPP